MRNICGVYKITNPIGQIYIGSSTNIQSRYHKYSSLNCKFQRLIKESIELYGWKDHFMEIIGQCDESELRCRERYWQDFYDVLNGGLNLVLEACGEKRREISESTSMILSKLKSGENHHFYGIKREDAPMYGKKHSEESKEKMSENHADFKGANSPRAKIVLNLETGIFYGCVQEAAEAIGVKTGTLTSWLSGKRPNKSNFIYCNND